MMHIGYGNCHYLVTYETRMENNHKKREMKERNKTMNGLIHDLWLCLHLKPITNSKDFPCKQFFR